ncbi:MAG: aminoacyl--tRNA ligase-related protein [Candidatus Nanosyncoccaceae bacterium]|jgi:prolyl-tRNA synthetase
MKRSELYIKTSKTAPVDEVAKNAQLLIRAGFIYKIMAGVYAYTPLGLVVLEKIKKVVREEMDKIGGQEILMTSLQPADLWKSTARWDDEAVDIWFKTRLKDETEIGLAWSHEEAILGMLRHQIKSYKDLPISVYQFQTKLRNELRAKAGIMRGREFLMKDMYSLHATKEDLDDYYHRVMEAYKQVFARLGLGDRTFVTFASGGAFTKFSHEFQTICEAGEDILYINREKNVAVNEEVLEEALTELGLTKNQLEKVKSAEVGNIFNFGTEKCQQMEVYFTDQTGERRPVYLASYGIGISRLMGVIAEIFADEKGLIWPEIIAPAQVYLISIGEVANKRANALYQELQELGVEVIFDDRDERPGVKFADAELMGVPYRVTLSERLGDQVELLERANNKQNVLTASALIAKLKANNI